MTTVTRVDLPSLPTRAAMLAVPWTFLIVLIAPFTLLLWPRIAAGHPLALVATPFFAVAFVSFTLAALTLSADIIRGRFSLPS